MAVLPTVEVTERLAAAVRSYVATTGTTYAALVREALRERVTQGMPTSEIKALLKELLRRLDEAPAPAQQICPVCRTPRTTDRGAMFAAMQHAQCDQIVAALDKGAST